MLESVQMGLTSVDNIRLDPYIGTTVTTTSEEDTMTTRTTQDIIDTRKRFANLAALLRDRKSVSTERRRQFTITRDQVDVILEMAELNGLI